VEYHSDETAGVLTNKQVADSLLEYLLANSNASRSIYKKKPQGVFGPLPPGWQSILDKGILELLGGLDKIKSYDEQTFVGGAISFQLDGAMQPDFYPLKPTNNWKTWPVVAAEAVKAVNQPLFKLFSKLKIFSKITNTKVAAKDKEKFEGTDIAFHWVQQQGDKYMFRASAVNPDKFRVDQPLAFIPPWGGSPQHKDAGRDCFIAPENQAAFPGNSFDKTQDLKGVYMCQADADGLPINHYAK